MKYNWLVILGVVFVIGLGIWVGIDMASKEDIQLEEVAFNQEIAYESANLKQEQNILETSASEENVSPNARIKKRIYYKMCDHLMVEEEKVANEDVNCTEKEIETKYSDWKVETFSSNQIELYQEVNQICPQHFKLVEEDGVIVLYQANEKGNYQLIDQTEIYTQYLSEEDREELRNGIFVIGEEKMNRILEDFE